MTEPFRGSVTWGPGALAELRREVDAEVLRLVSPDPGPTFYVDAAMQRVRDAVRRSAAAYPRSIPYIDTRPGQSATPSREEPRMNPITTRYATADEAAAAACYISKPDCDCANARRARDEFEAAHKPDEPRFRAVRVSRAVDRGGYYSAILDTSNGKIAPGIIGAEREAARLNDGTLAAGYWSWGPGTDYVIEGDTPAPARYIATQRYIGYAATKKNVLLDTETGEAIVYSYADNARRAAADLIAGRRSRDSFASGWTKADDVSETIKTRFTSAKRYSGDETYPVHVVIDAQTGKVAPYVYPETASRVARQLNSGLRSVGESGWLAAAEFSETPVRYVKATRFVRARTVATNGILDRETGEFASFGYRDVTGYVDGLNRGEKNRRDYVWTAKADHHATAQTPAEFPAEIGKGTEVRIVHKRDAGNVATKTVHIVQRDLGKVTAFATAAGFRYAAADYDLTIVSQPLPTEDGLYVVEGQRLTAFGTVYVLRNGGWFTRALPGLNAGLAVTADRVSRLAGAKRLVALEVAK